MTMLAVGILVADASEGVMERRLRKMLRWRPEMAAGRERLAGYAG